MDEKVLVSQETEDQVDALIAEIDGYREAIRDARDAMVSAEQELDSVLDKNYGSQD